jgi:hypothetical protein
MSHFLKNTVAAGLLRRGSRASVRAERQAGGTANLQNKHRMTIHDSMVHGHDQLCQREAQHLGALAFINAELSLIADLFKEASSQIQNVVEHKPAYVGSVLSKINVDRTLSLLSAREELQGMLSTCEAQLRK